MSTTNSLAAMSDSVLNSTSFESKPDLVRFFNYELEIGVLRGDAVPSTPLFPLLFIHIHLSSIYPLFYISI